MACIDLPALPLQILLRRNPAWEGEPAAVVDHDKPQGLLLWINERARCSRIRTGMRYAVALSLARDLRAGVVSRHEIETNVRDLVEHLQQFTPEVEPSAGEPGVFWLGASGLTRLFPSLALWGDRIRAALAGGRFASTVAVGFTRFGCYAAARAGSGTIVFESPSAETRHVRQVPLDRLGLDLRLRDALDRLGIKTLGGFLDLPAESVQRRFGAPAGRLHRMARGELWTPLDPAPVDEPLVRTFYLDHPETDLDRLLAAIDPLLESLLVELERRDAALASIGVNLMLEDGAPRRAELRPASPTIDRTQIGHLVRLRLEAMRLSCGVTDVEIRVTGSRVSRDQLALFETRPRRDPGAAARALARLRARFGEESVVRASLHDGHLPEARFHWEPIENVPPGQSGDLAGGSRRPGGPPPASLPPGEDLPPLVRRFYPRPLALPARPRHEPDGWLVRGAFEGPVEEVVGPYILSGGWWMKPVHRAYHFVRTRRGRWLWIFEDAERRGWFLHGEVE